MGFIKREKPCKGTGDAKGFGCNKPQLNRVYGLGVQCKCYSKWLLENDKGKKKKAPIKKVSDKRKEDNAVYKKLRDEFLSKPENQVCFIDGCERKANTIEHRAGRWGKNFLDTSTWAGCCLEHNLELENNPELSKKYQLSKITGKSKI